MRPIPPNTRAPSGLGWDELEDVYRARGRELVGLARGVTGDPHRGDDLVQEAFRRVYEARRSTAPPDLFLYLARAIINLARTEQRRGRTASRLSTVWQATTGGEPTPSEPEPSELLVAVRRLPQGQREALLARFWLDLSVSEAASLLGIAEGTIKAQTHRAITALRDQQAKGRTTDEHR